MSGFDPDWLDLREPADHAARLRAAAPLEAVLARFGDLDPIAVADIGSGSGSTLRALAPHLGPRQRWILIDNDPALLAHARLRLSQWADDADDAGAILRLRKRAATIEVATERHDLSADPLPAAAAAADLVTASAFFDLAGEAWITTFAARLAEARRPLYAALTIDGRTTFDPPHALDGEVLAAFDRDMARDKGFGTALAGAAPDALEAALARAGYGCVPGDSDWRLGGSPELARAFFEGMARAVAGGANAPPGLEDWLAFRTAARPAGPGALVGHRDLFAAPR